MTRVALYMRCSTEEQATEGLSIEGQRSLLHVYCKARGLAIVEEYVDEGRSGRSADRPEFQRMIATAKGRQRPWDMVLVIKWDRFARSVEDAAAYKSVLRNRCGVELIAVQQPSEDTATGRLVEGIMDVLAEFYSANLAEDVHRGMREKAKSGRGALGKPPFGYVVTEDDSWAIDEDEAAIVRWIYESYLDGMGTRAIAMHLRGPAGFSQFGEAARRRSWVPNTIRVVIGNPAYAGTRVWNRSRVVIVDGTIRRRPRPEAHHIAIADAHPAIIDADTWETVQLLRDSRAGGDRRGAEDYLLRGLLRCGDCGGTLCLSVQQSTRRRKAGPYHYVYRAVVCTRNIHTGECARQGIRYEELEAMVLAEIRGALESSHDLTFAPPTERRASQADNLAARLREIPARVDRQMQAYEVGAISLDELKAARDRLRAEEQAMRAQLDQKPESPNLLAFTARLNEALALAESGADMHTKRKALLRVVSQITWSKTRGQLEILWRLP
jgi:site-specific DNA recombinase